MKFSIVIPALNEEDAIANIIERCLDASCSIIEKTPVESTEIIVVSDGSSDKTEQIASQYIPEIKLIAYPVNRGYGAAIKMGFSIAEGELVAFLDADGTCDPLSFVPMINKLLEADADICIGNRLTPGTKMPKIRQVGNKIYATIVSLMGAGKVTDTASGMRVLKKESLKQIYPLPDGLNFTPAMSCRAILDDTLKIVDVPMHYEERVGKSKLSVVKDGFRFLATVIDVALTYRTFRILGSIGVSLMLLCLGYTIPLLIRYTHERPLNDGMIYRIAFILAVGVGGLTLFNIGLLSSRIIRLIHIPRPSNFKQYSSLFSLMNQKTMGALAVIFIFLSIYINRTAIVQYVTIRKVFVHWSVVMAGAFFLLMGIQFIAFAILDRVIILLHQRIQTSDLSEEAEKFLKK